MSYNSLRHGIRMFIIVVAKFQINTMLSQYNLVESVKGNLRIKVDLEQAMKASRGLEV